MEYKIEFNFCINLFLLSVIGCFVLCTPFANDPTFAHGIIHAKTYWFIYSVFWFNIISFLTGLYKQKYYLNIQIPDILLLLYIAWVCLSYNWETDPNREKLNILILCTCLWFSLRKSLSTTPLLGIVYFIFILFTGLVEVCWGLSQIYGYQYSNHSLYKLTGSFINPGPYSGYIGIILPLSLGGILKCSSEKKHYPKSIQTIIYWFSWTCFLAILAVLPAGMSRSAWIAGLVSCVWVVWCFKKKTIAEFYRKKNKKTKLAYFTITGILLLLCTSGIYFMKKDSADGRLLIWKITNRIISQNIITGTGLSGFSSAYAEAQAFYFSSGKGSSTEAWVAGNPDFAFNEYLHITAESGIPGFFLFMAWIISIIYFSMKNKKYIVTGGLIALVVFSFSSYPLQQIPFLILLTFLSVMGISGSRKQGGLKTFYFAGLLNVLISFFIFYQLYDYKNVYRQWRHAKKYYHAKEYEPAIEKYNALYNDLSHQPEFLFEYAQCLHAKGEYHNAILNLERANKLSGDPMIICMIAKNHQALCNYEYAEMQLLYALKILPERIYPYYMLSKLYAEPKFYNKEKLKASIDSVLYKIPKIESAAIKEMRTEVKKLYE